MIANINTKIEQFADEWIQKTHCDNLIETLQGFDFVEDCYRDLTDAEKQQISKQEFLDKLQKQIAIKF